MKRRTQKEKAERLEWLDRQWEELRQECNHLTDAERRRAREHAFSIIYGSDAR